MKKHYVSLETAKLLKEKGYNEPCANCYNKQGSIIMTHHVCNNQWEETKIIDCTAPELHEVQQWLREEHDIQMVIGVDVYFKWRDNDEDLTGENITNIRSYTYNLYICNKWLLPNKNCYVENEYSTYEEALEAGIIEALKMI